MTLLGAALTTVSFAALGLVGVVPPQAQLGLIVVAAIGFDFGIQATLVAHQTIVYGIDPPARSRECCAVHRCVRGDGDGRGTGQPGAWAMGLEWRGRAGDSGIQRRAGGPPCAKDCALIAIELG